MQSEDPVGQAKAIAEDGLEADFATVAGLVELLKDRKQTEYLTPMLIAVARRAIYRGWEAEHREALAKLLTDRQQFGYARKLLGRVRRESDSEELRQKHALATYKDMELPASRRLERALEILREGGALDGERSAETLGLAGSIYRRKWEVDLKRADLDASLRMYELGYARRSDLDPESWYAGINAAFACDQLAGVELVDEGGVEPAAAAALRGRADEIRRDLIAQPPPETDDWRHATLAEAHFGLEEFAEAREELSKHGRRSLSPWSLETTVMRFAALGRLRDFASEDVARVLDPLVGKEAGAVQRAVTGKVGLALSGGGFRASLFHIGVLARLAERNVLRHVEVLSCVSGGSILGAFYYLKLRKLLEETEDGLIPDERYVQLVYEVARDFLDGVRKDLRGQLAGNAGDNWKMFATAYSRTDRTAELLDGIFYAKTGTTDPDRPVRWRMKDLFVKPAGTTDFTLRYDNWKRAAKVPMLVLNATSLNTGHSWQFTASWMGEPPVAAEQQVDASRRLRRVYYYEAPPQHREIGLAEAVGASACVPGLFPPVKLERMYALDKWDDGKAGKEIDVELVDGGVHDNQGIASVLEQDCTIALVSDASGQIRDVDHAARDLMRVALRSNTVLTSRVRGAQYGDLLTRRRAGTLRGLMFVHLTKGLPAPPRDWSGCQEPYDLEDDGLRPEKLDPAKSSYGIDRKVQRALAELRTDLDAFSDDEAYSLMAAGYLMTKRDLEASDDLEAVPGLPPADPALEKVVTWPFAAALAHIENPGTDGRLLRALQAGRARFFRGFVARRLRPKGAVGRFLEKTKISAVPGFAGRAANTVVVTPVRAVVGAPLAVVGAVGTKLRRLFGRS